MTKWKQKVRFVLENETPQSAARGLAKELRRLPKEFRDQGWPDTLDDMIGWLDDVASDDLAEASDFDGVLSSIYDWADSHRLWLQTF